MKLANNKFFLFLCLVLAAKIIYYPLPALARIYIDINKPYSRKIPLALPNYISNFSITTLVDIGSEGSRILANDLAYTGIFDILDSKKYLSETDQSTPYLWRSIGADFLVTGNYNVQGDGEKIFLEMRLYDTSDGRLIVGKSYSGSLTDLRTMMHRFADEIMVALTGEYSIFSSSIAFVHADSYGKKEIWFVNFDGTGIRAFTHYGDITLYPAWSPNGLFITYSSYVNRRPVIFIHSVRDKEGRIIYNKPGINLTPVFIPTGLGNWGQMAISLSFSGKTNIYIGDQNGNLGSNLTDSWGIDVSPSFSPDGKKMVFVSDRGGSPQIYMRDMVTGNINRLSFGHKYAAAPDWSPRGDRIAYQAIVDGIFQIVSIRTDGSDMSVITTNYGGGEDPSWSPCGNFIAYASRSSGNYQIYVITPTGQLVRRITELAGDNTDPAWSPRGVIFN